MENADGIGTVTPAMVEGCARKLALINGHGSSKPTETDYQQAKPELTGDEEMLKDAGVNEKFAESLLSSVPALRIAQKNRNSAVALGFGQENVFALIKPFEKEPGVESEGTLRK